MQKLFFAAAMAMGAWVAPLARGAAPTNDPVPPSGSLSAPYRVECVASDLRVPWGIVLLPDGSIVFNERPGRVRLIDSDGKLSAEPLLVLPVALDNKMGLLGLSAHPQFSENRWLYLAYNYERDPVAGQNAKAYAMRVVRYTLEDRRLIAPKILLDDVPANRNHTGCRLRFGPDGMLYLTTGDANQALLAQALDSPLGKIMRLHPDGAVPADNPWVADKKARPEIWSCGHRNPQGLDFQPGTGRLLAAEHGPQGGDEVNWIDPGQNYGWPTISHRRTAEGLRAPLLEFSPALGLSAVVFYRGEAFPELKDRALIGCLRGEGILSVAFDSERVTDVKRLFHRQFGRIREIVVSEEGHIYFSTSLHDPPEGQPRGSSDYIFRIAPAQAPRRWPEHPASLPASVNEPAPPVSVLKDANRGAALARAHCANCHGEGMVLLSALRRPHGFWNKAPDAAALRRIVLDGLPASGMPGAAALLTPEELEALLLYLKTIAAPPGG